LAAVATVIAADPTAEGRIDDDRPCSFLSRWCFVSEVWFFGEANDDTDCPRRRSEPVSGIGTRSLPSSRMASIVMAKPARIGSPIGRASSSNTPEEQGGPEALEEARAWPRRSLTRSFDQASGH
jgi:hypothetical protein